MLAGPTEAIVVAEDSDPAFWPLTSSRKPNMIPMHQRRFCHQQPHACETRCRRTQDSHEVRQDCPRLAPAAMAYLRDQFSARSIEVTNTIASEHIRSRAINSRRSPARDPSSSVPVHRSRWATTRPGPIMCSPPEVCTFPWRPGVVDYLKIVTVQKVRAKPWCGSRRSSLRWPRPGTWAHAASIRVRHDHN